MPKLKLTVVAPVFNEEQVIAHFYACTRKILDSVEDVEANILFVVDLCTDNTIEVLRDIIAQDTHAKAIALSSRFGHQMSLLAGIEQALDADCIVMMDSDLQHPPELIPELIAQFRMGVDVVNTVRFDSEDVGFIRKTLGNLFYKVLRLISRTPIHANAADFRLISRRVARVISADFQERNMFLRGLISWMGFKQVNIQYTAARRFAGESKYSLVRMLKLAMAGILSFSTRPLHTGIFVGVAFSVLAFIYVLISFVTYFVDRSLPSGWTTLVILLLFFSGMQLIIIGIIGAYIGGIYEEVKGRPRYLIEEVISHDKESC